MSAFEMDPDHKRRHLAAQKKQGMAMLTVSVCGMGYAALDHYGIIKKIDGRSAIAVIVMVVWVVRMIMGKFSVEPARSPAGADTAAAATSSNKKAD